MQDLAPIALCKVLCNKHGKNVMPHVQHADSITYEPVKSWCVCENPPLTFGSSVVMHMLFNSPERYQQVGCICLSIRQRVSAARQNGLGLCFKIRKGLRWSYLREQVIGHLADSIGPGSASDLRTDGLNLSIAKTNNGQHAMRWACTCSSCHALPPHLHHLQATHKVMQTAFPLLNKHLQENLVQIADMLQRHL